MEINSENDEDVADRRVQLLFWQQLRTLKVNAIYIRLYRDRLNRWVTLFAVLRAIASNGGIAGWVVWRDYAFIWGAIIAFSQLMEALKDIFPFSARQKAANGLSSDLEALMIEVLFEWDGIYSGQYTADHIRTRWNKIMQTQHELDKKHFPNGNLPERVDLKTLAKNEASDYLKSLYANYPETIHHTEG